MLEYTIAEYLHSRYVSIFFYLHYTQNKFWKGLNLLIKHLYQIAQKLLHIWSTISPGGAGSTSVKQMWDGAEDRSKLDSDFYHFHTHQHWNIN